MGKLSQIVLKNILDALIKDESFAQSFAKSITRIFDISQPEPGTVHPFEDVINRIIEHCQGHISDIPGLRNNLIQMLRENEFLGFARVLRMLQDLSGYSDARLVNYLKKLRFQADSPWINIRETSKSIREKLNPTEMEIFTRLDYKQRCSLKGFSSEEINVMSMFSPRGLNILWRITHLSREQRTMIFALEETESRVFSDFGFNRVRLFSSLPIDERNNILNLSQNERRGIANGDDLLDAIAYMSSEQFSALRELFGRDSAILASLTEETADLAGSIYDLSNEERDRYLNLGTTELNVLNSFTKDQIRASVEFPNEVLHVANSLTFQQRDVILSLRQRDLETVTQTDDRSTLSVIQQIFLRTPSVIRSCSIITSEEESAILSLTPEQRLTLSKSYILGYDGLCMIRELGPELTNEVFTLYSEGGKKSEKFNVLQIALMKKLDKVNKRRSNLLVYFDEIELERLFGIMIHAAQDHLLNLSWKGVDLLTRLTNLDTQMIDIVRRLTSIEILTRNDKLTGREILTLGDLDPKEAKVLINLNIKQREYLSLKIDLTRLFSPLLTMEERKVLGNLSKLGRRVYSTIIPLSNEERSQLRDTRGVEGVILRRMRSMDLDFFFTLTADEVSLLSSFTVWHLEEDLVFTLLGMESGTPRPEMIEQIETSIKNIPRRMSVPNYDNVSKILANTIETLRITGAITNDLIGDITSLVKHIHGEEFSMVFKLQLLNLSMRDSKSLESVLVPQIAASELNISLTYGTKIHTIEDLMFIRWILSQPLDFSGGIFYKFAMTTLNMLSNHISDDGLDILLSESTSQRDGIPHERVLNGFRHMLKAEDYFLATSFFLGSGQEGFSDTSSALLIRSLTSTFTPDDIFKLLISEIDHSILDTISSSLLYSTYRGILFDGRFDVPNVFQVSLYYNCGDLFPLMETLGSNQLWMLFKERPHVLLQLMARNQQIELFELLQKVSVLNQIMRANRISIFKSVIEDFICNRALCPTRFHFKVANTIRYLAYSDSFIGAEHYITLVSEYLIYLESRVTRDDLRAILDSFVCDDVSRTDLIRSLRDRLTKDSYSYLQNDGDRSCSYLRKKRFARMICVDSESTKEVLTEEEKRSIGRTFDTTKIEHLELYDELLEYSEREFQGQPVDPEALNLRMRDVPLDTIDRRIKDIVEQIKDDDLNKIGPLLKKSGTMIKINEVASATGFIFTVFLVGKHLVHGDLTNLGFDALNLWIMPKFGQQITEKLTDLAGQYDSAIAEKFAPVVGAGVSNLVAFFGLIEGIKARAIAVDPVDMEIANLNIITNSVFIAVNVPAAVSQITSSVELGISVIGEIIGPYGVALSAAVIITSYLISLSLEVKKFAEHIKLSDQEQRSLYWNFFLDEPAPENLRIDKLTRDLYTQYLYNALHNFKEKYDKIVVSLPQFLIVEKECIPRIDEELDYCSGCTLKEKNTSLAMDFSQKAIARNPFSPHHERDNSRLIPDELEGYNIVCAPSANNALELNVNSSMQEPCPTDAVYHNTKWDFKMKKLFLPVETTDDCDNMVSFKKRRTPDSTRILFYVAQDASIVLSNDDFMDMFFFGTNISITDREDTRIVSNITQNRFHFRNYLRDCRVHKKGQNFFYVRGNEFKCDLGNKTTQQHNIVLIRNDFTDSDNIHTIVGSEAREKIEAHFAGYVDGKGGGDMIQATKSTIVKGYFDDFITGECLVLLPLNVSDISSLLVTTRVGIHNKEHSSIVVDGNTALVTADQYLFTPIRTSNITYKVTHAHIRKTLGTEIILESEVQAMRAITIVNCTLIKQLSSANYDIILTDVGHNVFYADKNHHNFYWESSEDYSDVYVFGKLFANVTVSKANGILNFQELKMEFDPKLFHWNVNGEIEINIGGLRVMLLPNYKNVTLTFDGRKNFKVENKEIVRDYCSHSLRIVGRLKINGTDLHDHFNCFEFNSKKILFLKLDDDLTLVSGRQVLSISNYYSSLHEKIDLSLKLNDYIIVPQVFQQRAKNPHKLIYYDVDGSGLQIYHNQPVDKHHIGFVDLKDKSILDLNITMKDRNMLLVFDNVTVVEIENWVNYQPGRELMFAFNDSFLSNAECIISTCKPTTIIGDFEMAKAEATRSRLRPKRHFELARNGASSISNFWSGMIQPFRTLDGSNYPCPGFYITTMITSTFVLLQHYFDQKYPLPRTQLTSDKEILASVIDLTEKYHRVFSDTARQFDLDRKNLNKFKLYTDIMELVRREDYHRIPNVFYSAAKKSHPQREEFLTNLKKNIDQIFYR